MTAITELGYVRFGVSPSGFQVEIGCSARPATHQSEYYVRDTYGHEFNPRGRR